MEEETQLEKPSKKKEKKVEEVKAEEIPNSAELKEEVVKVKKKQTREYVMTPARAAAVERMKEARLKKATEANESKAKKAELVNKLLEEDRAKKQQIEEEEESDPPPPQGCPAVPSASRAPVSSRLATAAADAAVIAS